MDGDEEDDLITSFVEATEIYIKNATSKNVDLKSELAKLAARILMLIGMKIVKQLERLNN